MSEFKSTPSRLARLFRASRDKWKEKAIEKQRKLRALEVKVRDLSGSREYWKNRAMAAEKGLNQEDGENFSERKDELELINSEEEDEEGTENCQAKNHHYPVDTVKKTMELFMKCGISFRGIEKTLELFNDLAETKTPSFSCIRKWLGRMGLYELNREKEYRQDWIFISYNKLN